MAKARWFRPRKRRAKRRPARSARPRRVRLRLEWLEDRTSPSTGGSIASAYTVSFPDSATLYQTVQVAEYLASPDDTALNRIMLNAGDVVVARVSTVAYGGGLNSYLRVFADAGGSVTQVASNDDSVGRDAGVTFQAPASGPYYIGVSSFDNRLYNPAVADSGAGSSHGLFDLSLSKTTAAPAPDLEGASFQVSPALAVWGDTITVNFSVENRGGLAAAATTVSLVDSADNRFDDNLPVLQSAPLPALAAGASYKGTFTVQLGALGTPPSPFGASQTVFLGLQIGAATPASPEQGNDWASAQMLQSESIAAGQGNVTLGSAMSITLNSRTSSVELPPGVENLYQIVVTEPGNLNAQLSAAGGPTSLTLYDSRGIPLVQSDGQSTADLDPSISQGLTGSSGNSGPVYYLKVANRGVQAAAYSLTTLFTPSASTLQAVSVQASEMMIASGDFNGDGLTDLVTANGPGAMAADDLTVMLGSNVGFQNAGAIDLGMQPQAVAVGDFTGNGRLDLAVATATSIEVLLGNGDGAFQSPLIDAALGGTSLAAGDFNGDGLLDLAVGNVNTNSISILWGNGNGTFQAPVTMADPGGPSALAAGDLNGDGQPDLVTINPFNVGGTTTDDVTVLLANGDGSFRTARAIDIGAPPQVVAVGDFTGDGLLDLAVATATSIEVLPGNGKGAFQSSLLDAALGGTALAVGNFSSGGPLELAVGDTNTDSISIVVGNGDGTFQRPQPLAGSGSPSIVVTGDFTGEGSPDLVAVSQASLADGTTAAEATLFLPNGDGTFRSAGSFNLGLAYAEALAVGDFNGDGRLDLVATFPGINEDSATSAVSVLLGNGNGTFQAPLIDTGTGGFSLAVGDFTGDGVLDLAVSNFLADTVNIFLGNGNGTFQPPLTMAQPNAPSALATADFNGDGRFDLAVGDADSNQVVVLLSNGDGTFQNAGFYNVAASPFALVAGRFTANGPLDLAVADSRADEVSVLLGNGNGTFQAPVSYAAGGYPIALVTADFNGDGRLDLATVNESGNNVSILLGNGDGTFQAALSYAVGAQPESLVAAAFTSDGWVDLATANSDSNNVTVLLANGAGGFLAPAAPNSTGKFPEAIVSGDFNGDDRLDLAVADGYSNSVTILLGQGDGTFQSAGTFAAGNGPNALVAGDFNGDGRLDLAVADYGYYGGSGVTVLLGNGNGTFQTAGSYSVGGAPDAIVADDFNGDGNLDLAVAVAKNPDGSNANTVALLLGDGRGGFSPGGMFAVGSQPYALVGGVFTGNGHYDLAVADYASQDVTVLLGDGHGAFPIHETYGLPGNPTALTTGDFTGDNRLDLAVEANVEPYSDTSASPGEDVFIMMNNGGGSFSPGASYPVNAEVIAAPNAGHVLLATSDLTGDGLDDLVAATQEYSPDGSGGLLLFLSNGNGTFQAPATFAVAAPSGPVVGDFNGDGRPDIAVPNYSGNTLTVLLGAGNGQFVAPVLAPSPVESTPLIADLTGRPDAIELTQSGQILFRHGLVDEPGAFAAPVVLNPDPQLAARDLALVPTTAGVPLLAALDANTFPVVDDPTAEPAPRVIVYRSNGDGTFTTLTSLDLPAGFLPANIASADLTGDGLGDLVITAAASDQVFVVLQTAPGVFGAATAYSIGMNPAAIELTDLNDDSLPDIAVADRFSGQLSVLLNLGNGVFAPEQRFDAGTGLYDQAAVNGIQAVQSSQDTVGTVAGNFTRAITPDLTAFNAGTASFTVLPGDGSGGFLNPQPALTHSTGATPTAVVSGYFVTGNSNLDLAVLSEASGTISIYLGDGHGGFTLAQTLNAGNQPTGLSVADVSRPGGGGPDGIADLLIGNQFGDLLILAGKGDGTFSQYRRADQGTSLAVAAMSNGQNTFFFSDQGNDQLAYVSAAAGTKEATGSVYQNRQAGIFAPGPESVVTVGGTQYLVVVNSGANDLLVYALGPDGQPILASKQTYATGTDPVSLTVTNAGDDLNGDDIPDLLVANQGSNDVSVFLGQLTSGDWSLVARPRQSSGGIGPTSVAVANGAGGPNGLPSLLVSNGGSNSVNVLPSQGNGFFTTNKAPLFTTGTNPTQLIQVGTTALTVNSGSNDLTIANSLDGRVIAIVPSGGEDPVAAAVIDDNGINDLLVSNAGDGSLELLVGGVDGFESAQAIGAAETAYYSDLFVTAAGNLSEVYGTIAGSETAQLLATFGPGAALDVLPPVPGFPSGVQIAGGGVALSAQAGAEVVSLVQVLIIGLTAGNLSNGEPSFLQAEPSGGDVAPDADPGARPASPARKLGAAGGILLLNVEPDDHPANPPEKPVDPNDLENKQPDDEFMSDQDPFPSASHEGSTGLAAMFGQTDISPIVRRQTDPVDLPSFRNLGMAPVPWFEVAAARDSVRSQLPAESEHHDSLADTTITKQYRAAPMLDEPIQASGQRTSAAGAAIELEFGGNQAAPAPGPHGWRESATAMAAAIVSLGCWLPWLASGVRDMLWWPRPVGRIGNPDEKINDFVRKIK